MVWVEVCAKNAQQGELVEMILNECPPCRFSVIGRNTSVDHGPALLAIDFVFQKPEIDVI